ncbi:switch-associated protein 70-like isoform X1 [Acanthopagrus latus]|uniref:switch-associated protein 70-like isoform X1 n=1 Tax=Acanthopagrus latus TaxID=8177 RepID=UPI00187CEF30|nr:switch-associated protein 70-like isoform X1 [Acanthopagrus latus]
MWLREELLKSIWHAFTALDVDQRGKVSKSQLKVRSLLLSVVLRSSVAITRNTHSDYLPACRTVLSHSLCTVMKIPHDPVALEEHFKDDDKGPLSDQGYMPYLNRFILDKVREEFDVLEFNKMCWTLCYKKNICTKHLLISDDDAFKVWCIFNFLSEEKYPLVIITEEIEYFLHKLLEAMGSGWSEDKFSDYKLQLSKKKNCLTAWELIELVGMGYFSKGLNRQTLSMGITEVFQELILDVLKQGYMMKKGHKRKNWTERWFVLRPNSVSYYVCEDLVEKKGDIILDRSCCVESLPDKEGKKCLFIIKCTDKSFEISASDKKKRQEWIQAIQTCIQLLRLGLLSPHRESRLRRRELRQRQQVEEEDLAVRMKQLQLANDNKQRQLEAMRRKMEEAAARGAIEEQRRKKTQEDLQDRYRLDLEREKMVRQQMEEQMAQKSSELELYLQRVRELEDMYHRLEEALEDERQAKQDEEAMRKLQARLLEEEAAKRAELEHIHLQQQRALSQTEAEKQELMAERLAKERDLQAAMQQLDRLERERHGALEQYEEVSRKLERAANKTKTWKDKVAKHEGLVRLIQPGNKEPQRITNWGPASFTDAELDLRKKVWQERKNQGAQAQ